LIRRCFDPDSIAFMKPPAEFIRLSYAQPYFKLRKQQIVLINQQLKLLCTQDF